MDNRRVDILSGGTMAHVRPHLALCAPASGRAGRMIRALSKEHDQGSKLDVVLHETRLANPTSAIVTNDDVAQLLDRLIADPLSKIIFMPVALVDYEPAALELSDGSISHDLGRDHPRLSTRRDPKISLQLQRSEKLLGRIRRTRKDLFAVAFKTTAGADADAQYLAGLNLLKESSANLVLANDLVTRLNMVITPEEARYHVTTDRREALAGLVDMTFLRSHLTFTRSTVVGGDPVAWSDPRVPASLRAAVDHCISRGAYKMFRGVTAGHFAVKLDDNTFLTSKRKTNFNELSSIGLVLVKTDGPDSVLAFGAKPSVGGQSQRIVFEEHPEYDCIVHFHCPLKPGHHPDIPVVSQREFECGSHECGSNTSRGLARIGELSVVYLREHGPNIVFHRSIAPEKVIRFIDENFDLAGKTGGTFTA